MTGNIMIILAMPVFLILIFVGFLVISIPGIIATRKLNDNKYAHTVTTVSQEDYEIYSLIICANTDRKLQAYYIFYQKTESGITLRKIKTNSVVLCCTDKHPFYRVITTQKVRQFNDKKIVWQKFCDCDKDEKIKRYLYVSQADIKKLNLQ